MIDLIIPSFFFKPFRAYTDLEIAEIWKDIEERGEFFDAAEYLIRLQELPLNDQGQRSWCFEPSWFQFTWHWTTQKFKKPTGGELSMCQIDAKEGQISLCVPPPTP